MKDRADLTVAIETSSRSASVAAAVGDRILEAALKSTRAHGSDLLPTLRGLLQELGAAPSQIRAVIVGIGPGSYTGLRVGAATALGLARASGAALRGVPSGEALAYGVLKPGEEAMQLLDARSGGLTFGHYRRLTDEVATLAGPRILTPDDARLAIAGSCPIYADASAVSLAALDAHDAARVRTDIVPKARDVLVLGRSRLAALGPHGAHEIEPLYLRAFTGTRPNS